MESATVVVKGSALLGKRRDYHKKLAAIIQLNGHGLTQKAISRIETGERIVPDFEIPLLATALNVDPLWLLGITECNRE